MARGISQACALWVDQRIEEELKDQPITNKSVRRIGLEISREIEKYFEVKVNPSTIERRTERKKSATNVAHNLTTRNNNKKSGNNGNKIKTIQTIKKVKNKVDKGKSIRQASKEVADETGISAGSIKNTFLRNKKKQESESNEEKKQRVFKERERMANEYDAMDCARSAIRYLETTLGKIKKRDRQRKNAFQLVRQWLDYNE